MIEKLTLEEYEARLKAHDWYYNYTEDRRKYYAGQMEYETLCEIAKQSKEHEELFMKYKKEHDK